ncbi:MULTISPECIES: AI-2E family transporter [unclassified Algoriphagus]|jgi:predicted PurR-regulated permease PerM|uniref:AI-2E family transporter n=2 Tax=Algoriphagus TaxID=246875 RepID=UPI000C5A129C|nr:MULTISPECIES: AI-2E family transporter [unclassified Algoriphagus]MAL13439.1 AI-2E family transporter [Algoriphagus sp.]HAD53413.1 AI-2E family transporter [Algoriphagus sp.]HAH38212.1 AI-2E family transporter [Algoriphagus sp.]HAS58963.1 AI-2E family transporter [Algoriphagus sp.]HCH46054.1 AI-2E family transporter [Algoriphagus sp.]|tara:strand:+ start:1086 stop:2180 length:1095 start_codon:yes stop_codon:yes gene_type:complete
MQRFFIYLFLFIGAFLLFGWYFSNITAYLILSLILAALLRPLTNRLNDFHIGGQHVPRWTAILISYSAIVILLILLGLLFFPLINNQLIILSNLDLEGIYQQIQIPIARIENFLLKYQLIESQPGYLFEEFKSFIVRAITGFDFGSFISQVFSTASSLFIGLIAVAFITFFLLLENGLLRRNLLNLIPNPYFELSVATFTKVEKLLSNYLSGLLLQILAIFTIASLGLSLMRIEYALTIALFAAIANLIPYAGPILGAMFGIIVGISTGSYSQDSELTYLLIKILSVFSIVQIIDNILLQPMIFSKSVKAHPLEIFVVIFAGAKIAGVLGMIFAIPVYTIFRVSVMEFYKGYKSYRIFKIKTSN